MYYTIEFLNRSTVSSPDYLNYVAQFDCTGNKLIEGGDPSNDDDYHLIYEAYVLEDDRQGFERAIDSNSDVVCWNVQ